MDHTTASRPPITTQPDAGHWSRDRREQNEAWDRDAMATVGPMCAEPGCLHSTQRRYPGLPASALEWCPVHADTPAHPGHRSHNALS